MPKLFNADAVILKRYRIVDQLAFTAGGQSIAFRGVDIGVKRGDNESPDVFIKQYHDMHEVHDELQNVEDVYKELNRRIKKNRDSYCLPIDVGVEKNSLVAVFPYIDGDRLADIAHRLVLDDKIRVLLELANALDLLHRADVAHLDIKPENILLERTEANGLQLRLIDFDACWAGEMRIRESVLGTDMYIAPEQAAAEIRKDTKTAADVFSFGNVSLELLMDEHPFAGTKNFYDDVVDRVVRISGNRNRLPIQIVSSLLDCLHPDPTLRPGIGNLIELFSSYRATGWTTGKNLSSLDSWKPPSWMMEIKAADPHSKMGPRRYFEQIELGRDTLRQSGIRECPKYLAFIDFCLHGCLITRIDERTDISIDGRLLAGGERLLLNNRHTMVVKDVDFLINCQSYAGEKYEETNGKRNNEEHVSNDFLYECRKSKRDMTVFLINGVKIQGIISSFDKRQILLRRDGHVQLVRIPSISMIVPTISIK